MIVRTTPSRLPGQIHSEQTQIQRALRQGAHRAAARGRALLVRKTPVDTGQLRNSWKVRAGQGDLLAELFNDAPHAAIVEMGARPHAVNRAGIEALYRWVWRHRKMFSITARTVRGVNPEVLGIAFAIARKIKKRGQRPTYFVRNQLDRLRAIMGAEIKSRLARISKAAR